MEKISIKERISYGLGSMGYNIANASLATFILMFYSITYGAEMYSKIIIIITVSKIFDAFTDIPVGYIIDKTNSRWGKSRPYLLFLAIPFAIILSSIFYKPNFDSSILTYIYIIVTYNLLLLVYTGVFLSDSTLNMQITNDNKQRLYLNIFRVMGGFIITIIINATTNPLLRSGFWGDIAEGSRWWLTWTGYGILGAIFFILCFAGTKERITAPNNYNLKNIAKAVSKNYIISLASYMFCVMKRFLMVVPSIFFCNSWFGNPALVGIFTAAFLMPMSMALMFSPLFFKFEKAKLIAYSNIIYIFTFGIILVLGLVTGNIPFWLMIVCTVINGIAMAPHEVLAFPLFIDVIEENFNKKNVRIEGPIYSGSAIVRKIGEGLVFFMTGILTAAYVASPETNMKSTSILILFILVPIIISILTIIILRFYKNDYELKTLKKI